MVWLYSGLSPPPTSGRLCQQPFSIVSLLTLHVQDSLTGVWPNLAVYFPYAILYLLDVMIARHDLSSTDSALDSL